nr:MAG TPA: hypothetical protein [Caudoviricetes sp.]
MLNNWSKSFYKGFPRTKPGKVFNHKQGFQLKSQR